MWVSTAKLAALVTGIFYPQEMYTTGGSNANVLMKPCQRIKTYLWAHYTPGLSTKMVYKGD